MARIAGIGPESIVHWFLASCVLLINRCFNPDLTNLTLFKLCELSSFSCKNVCVCIYIFMHNFSFYLLFTPANHIRSIVIL